MVGNVAFLMKDVVLRLRQSRGPPAATNLGVPDEFTAVNGANDV
jgi:hypothetical protein